jgi:putative membrane protein insertion efficiency factor
MKKIITTFFFVFYKTIIKGVLYITGAQSGPTCKFHPTCSVYARECFIKYRPGKAFVKTLKRIVRCHPWNSGGVDLP